MIVAIRTLTLGATGFVLLLTVSLGDAMPGSLIRVSINSDGHEVPFGAAEPPVISANGDFLAWRSASGELVPNDTNNATDIFVRSLRRGTTERVSVASDGSEANSFSTEPAISRDGRFVAFTSFAANLDLGDTNGAPDVFVRDRREGTTVRVSVASDGSQGNGYSDAKPSISGDGRLIAFESSASNLVPGDTNEKTDIFVHDRFSQRTVRVSVSSDGLEANGFSVQPAISSDGRFVAFYSLASNLVPNDTNGTLDVLVRDLKDGVTERASVSSTGQQANAGSVTPAISGNGRFVAFISYSTNLVPNDNNFVRDVFLRDRKTGLTSRVSTSSTGAESNGPSYDEPAMSHDGRLVGFTSDSSNLVPTDTNGVADVFLKDRITGLTSLVSTATDGTQGNGFSGGPAISDNGKSIAFLSVASNLVPDDTNGDADIYVREQDACYHNRRLCQEPGDGEH